jgi:cytochrome c
MFCLSKSSYWVWAFCVLLLCAVLLIAEGVQAKPELPEPGPNATPASAAIMTRLEPPPFPTNPTQADQGAQAYWLHCQPCHGDRGQGLTNEWRTHYPPEEQNCWQSGCHGQHPHPNAFVLPASAPAVIGSRSLLRFATAADLHTFVSQTMPYQAPGSLSPADYWAITAFLLVEHGLSPDDLPIQEAISAQQIKLHPLTSPERDRMTPTPPNLAMIVVGGLLPCGLVVFFWRRLKH